MGEFEFIAELLADLSGPEGLMLRDDAAIWAPPAGQDAVITADTIIEGVHFPKGKFDAQVARKLLRVSVSDLTAKGANPRGYLLSLSLPEWVTNEALEDFTEGLGYDQAWYGGLTLWGGDTTRISGPCVLSATMIGTVSTGTAVLRSGAKAGHCVCVTGTIGDGYLGLGSALERMGFEDVSELATIYHVPNPPFKARDAIRKYASASIDISDGLLADAGHLAKASGVIIDLKLVDIPLSVPARSWIGSQVDEQEARLVLASGGDDYQALMTVPQHLVPPLQRALKRDNIALSIIGSVSDSNEHCVRCFDDGGVEITLNRQGYTHF